MPISLVGKIKPHRAYSAKRLGAQCGITLMELTVVLAVVGMVAAITYPSAASGIDGVRLTSATGSVSSFLNSAVNRAERRQQPVEVTITPKDGVFHMYSNDGFEKQMKLPDGITIQAIYPTLEGEGPEAPQRLLLMPGATVPGIGVQLINQHGTRRIVRIDPMTGFPRVENVRGEGEDK